MSSTPESVSATRSLAKALTEQKRITLDICYIKRDYALYHVVLHDFDTVQRKRKAVPTSGWSMERLVAWDGQTAQLRDDREGWLISLLAARNEWKGHMDKYKDLAKDIVELKMLVAAEKKARKHGENDAEDAEENAEEEAEE